jgi:hypothetical protein
MTKQAETRPVATVPLDPNAGSCATARVSACVDSVPSMEPKYFTQNYEKEQYVRYQKCISL